MDSIKSALDIIRARQLIVLATLVIGVVVAFFAFHFVPRTYQAASQVLIANESDGRDPTVTSLDLPSVATSTVVLSRVLDDLKIPVTLTSLKKSIKASVGQHSSIMDISYQDVSPDRAVAVPNAVADELARYYSSISSSRATEDVQKLDATLQEAQKRLQTINEQLASATTQGPFLGTEKPLEALTGRLDELETQRALANATLNGDQAAAGALSASSSTMSRIARHEILQSDDFYHQLASGTSKDAAQLAFDRAEFTDRFPGLRSLSQKVQSEQAFVKAEQRRMLASPDAYSPSQSQSTMDKAKAEAIVTGDHARVTELDGLIATTRARLVAFPQASTRFTWLRLQQAAAQADYLALSGRRTAAVANRAEALSLGSVVVVDRAVRANTTVVGLGRKQLALATALLIFSLAICMAFLADVLDPRLRRAEQIERLYGSPLIGTLGGKQ